MKRRTFLLSALATGGALVVGYGLLPPRSRSGDRHSLPVEDGQVGLNGWLKIRPDGQVVLAMHRSEMGQGVHTALPMLVAEELDIPLSKVQLEQAGSDAIYGNVAMFLASLPFHPSEKGEDGQRSGRVVTGEWLVAKFARELGVSATGGSTSMADAWDVLRLAAATARAQLLGAASLRWRLPVSELRIIDGVVSHASGSSGHFGELARAAAALSVSEVRLKPPQTWKLIGRSAPRLDVPAKVDGSAVFGIDVRLPGMVYGVVRMCPMLGGSYGRVDVDGTLRRPGVERVVRLGAMAGSTAGVAVVGRSYWHARQAADAMQVEWRPPPHEPAAGLLDSRKIARRLEAEARRALHDDEGFAFYTLGEVASAEAGAARRLEQVYRAPYLAHATMEPVNCTARVADGKVEVWVSTQAPTLARDVAARIAGVDPEKVTVHVKLLGGGFGRRLDVDYVAQAVRVAMELGGRPVQLIWPREEDLTHDFYRPAAVAVLRASLDAKGRPLAFRFASAGDAITPRWVERGLPTLTGPVDLPDKTTAEGLFDLPYEVPHQRISHAATRSGVPVGYWRSVGHSHNAFFSEAFVDELAHEARQDPVAFRLSLLEARPRHQAVLKLAAEKAGWNRPATPGRGRGVALHESFGSIVAQVVEVSLEQGRVRVHRVVCAMDCGTVVNPGIVAQQMESAVIFGLSAALYGRIDVVQGAVQQRNFPDYRLLSLAETPQIETHLVRSSRSPSGVGEPGTPPLAPALANALFTLTGQRLRSLPLTVTAT
ncbi:xanthine dehydrogenase family protein molybdopterin-binding subunit [Aquabacterium sp. A7-Y]|uniref:xanthine dehydrogenase family protein molybdopterin-binding subunit n=1 Tax=Aquabacterium sp. A7-Y TaxID=1349605 RepID=UPI00223DD155|nr:xanthine dehydrogenase family protein molybdopterin-binding subunit [Aquabacterium sp. A7-Y]MCW7538856.1 xanthine dehydrogenase family protein molybdopterin-binding subunit [Aquabacterium sp. A7-Y]